MAETMTPPKGPAERAAEIKTPVKLTDPCGGELWRIKDADGLNVCDLYNKARAERIVTALNNYASIEQEVETLRNAFQKEQEICKQAEQHCFEKIKEIVVIEQENQRLEQLVCDFQAAGQIDVGGMNGPCRVEPRHIEQHVTELQQENQRLREGLKTIATFPVCLEPVGGAHAMQELASQALATDKRG